MFAIDHVYPIAYNAAPFHFVTILAQINLDKTRDYLDLKNKKDNIYPRKLLFRLFRMKTYVLGKFGIDKYTKSGFVASLPNSNMFTK